MKLRIAMVGACPYPAPQGSQVFMRNTAQCLEQSGHEVHLLVYGYGMGSEHSGLRIHRAAKVPLGGKTEAGPSLAKPFQDMALTFALRRLIRSHHIQIVCAHNYEALLTALLVGKRPILYFAHNAMSDELPHFFNQWPLAERFGSFLDRTFPRRADVVITPHQRLAGHLVLRGCRPETVKVVPPPMDAHLFTPAAVIHGAMPPVIYAGNLDAYQNLPLLFEAMRRVRLRKPGARLVIATAARTKGLEAEMAPIPGFDALHPFLSQDAVFAAPRVSWSGYPIKLLNAMAAGKAVVACESAAYPIEHGVTGLVVPDNDADAFASALIKLLDEPNTRAAMGVKAREAVQERNLPEKIAAELNSIVLDAFNRRPRQRLHGR